MNGNLSPAQFPDGVRTSSEPYGSSRLTRTDSPSAAPTASAQAEQANVAAQRRRATWSPAPASDKPQRLTRVSKTKKPFNYQNAPGALPF